MPKLPRVPACDVLYVLERLGFVQIRQRGSHVILKKQVIEGKEQKVIEVGCVVPLHRKTMAIGTLKSILNQAGVSVKDFLDIL